MKEFFTAEHPFWIYMSQLGWAVLFNILFIITSIPLITMGSSITALYTVMFEIAANRRDEDTYVHVYFKALWHSLKDSTIVWIITIIVALVWSINLHYFSTLGSTFGDVMYRISQILAFFSYMYFLTVFVVGAKFESKWKEMFKIAFIVLSENILKVFIAAMLAFVIVVGIIDAVIRMNVFSWMIIIVFGLAALVSGSVYNKMFNKYIEEDIEEEWHIEE